MVFNNEDVVQLFSDPNAKFWSGSPFTLFTDSVVDLRRLHVTVVNNSGNWEHISDSNKP